MKQYGSRQTVRVRNVILGDGKLKLIMPLIPRTAQELIEAAKEVLAYNPDILEWRIDYFENVENIPLLLAALQELRNIIQDAALMVTLRHPEENGVRQIDSEKKANILQAIIQSGWADMVDIELRYGKEYINALGEVAQKHGVKMIVSYHDLERTPDESEVLSILKQEQDMGADILKVSFVAQRYGDIAKLGTAIIHAKERIIQKPIISVSASQVGVLSRIGGDVFGSDATFVSCGKTHQIHINDLRILRQALKLS